MINSREHIKPSSSSWVNKGWHAPPSGMQGVTYVYDHPDGTRMISGCEMPTEDGWEFHISISRAGRRVSNQEARQVLLGLDSPIRVEEWLEDNHQPGIARNFWCHTDPTKRAPCDCQGNEQPIEDGDFVWRKIP